MKRLVNPFFLGIILWAVCFFGYTLNWSELCQPLDLGLIAFLGYLLALLGICGLIYPKINEEMEDRMLIESNTTILTAIIVLVLFAGMLYAGTIPILDVANGSAYNNKSVSLPFIGAFATSLALFQCFRVSFLFFSTKNKRYIFECVFLFLPFLMMLQRQNLIILLVGFVYAWVATRKAEKWTIRKKILIVVSLIFCAAVALFLFGAIGNVRYGIWDWNDSSMISKVGGMNDNYPVWLPKEYFWAYIYLVTPLANLNNNVLIGNYLGDIGCLISQLLPSSITKIFGVTSLNAHLVQPSLIVCTAFIQPFLSMGYNGMYVYITLTLAVLLFACAEKGLNAPLSFAINSSICYFLVMMLFDNPSTYLITAYLLLICICVCVNNMRFPKKLVKKIRREKE